MERKAWQPESWRAYVSKQQPDYPDPAAHEAILQQIRIYPPLVSIGEVQNLRWQLAEAGQGRRFILQGGNCAERFIDCNEQTITNHLKIILQMSVILMYGIRKPAIRIGRVAGQYAKPRSNNTENINGKRIPSYRGDSVNSYEPERDARMPDPQRLLQSYFHAAATLNFIRGMIGGGFADLHDPYNWKLHSIDNTSKWADYSSIVDHILDAIDFMEAFGALRQESLGKVDFFTSHEGLLLGYEEALTRRDPESGRFYNLGAHMLWIGHRTRAIDGAHIEYFRGIANPIAMKVGPGCDPEELLALLAVLNPKNDRGRITLITRLGVDRVERDLPPLIRAVGKAKLKVTWSCDPMHGNLTTLQGSRKTRDFNNIIDEFRQTFRLHQEQNSLLAGAHFELTGEDVTECIGGAVALKNDDLHRNYDTYCDPRLNYAQSLEMAFLIAKLFQAHGIEKNGAYSHERSDEKAKRRV